MHECVFGSIHEQIRKSAPRGMLILGMAPNDTLCAGILPSGGRVIDYALGAGPVKGGECGFRKLWPLISRKMAVVRQNADAG